MDERKAAIMLFECRNTVREELKDKYRERITPFADILIKTMDEKNIQLLPALLEISKGKLYNAKPYNQLMFMAAVAELIITRETMKN